MDAGLLAVMGTIVHILTSECILFYPHHGLSEAAVSQPQFDGPATTCFYLPAKA